MLLVSGRGVPAKATGNLTRYNDDELNGLSVEISDSFSGTYVLDPTGTGRVDSSVSFNARRRL